jgi:APA family basic amino acid/polyamine antiporter
MAGLTLSARVLGVITVLKLLAFVAVVVVAFAAGTGSWWHFEPLLERQTSTVPLGEAMALGVVSVFFLFRGFWEASRMAGEAHDATRTLPAALAIGVACVTVVYVATTTAFVYLVRAQQVTSASEFARHAGEAMLGPDGPSVLAAIVLLSVVASALALLIMAPRLYVAMSRDGLFPSSLARVNAVTQSPVRATALLAVLASVFVSLATFQQIVAFFMCTTLGFIALAAAARF